MATQIGFLKDIINSSSTLNRYILQGVFEDISLGGDAYDIEDDFLIDVPGADYILIRKEDNMLNIDLSKKHNGKDKTIFLTNKFRLKIDYSRPGFPVFRGY